MVAIAYFLGWVRCGMACSLMLYYLVSAIDSVLLSEDERGKTGVTLPSRERLCRCRPHARRVLEVSVFLDQVSRSARPNRGYGRCTRARVNGDGPCSQLGSDWSAPSPFLPSISFASFDYALHLSVHPRRPYNGPGVPRLLSSHHHDRS